MCEDNLYIYTHTHTQGMIKSAEIKCFSVAANLIFYHVFTKSNKLGRPPGPYLPATRQEVVVRTLRISCAPLRDSSLQRLFIRTNEPSGQARYFCGETKHPFTFFKSQVDICFSADLQ